MTMSNSGTWINQQFSLNGRIFVVTGASSGIGRAIAGFLSQAGAKVVVMARRQAQLDLVCEEIKDLNGEASSVCADLSDLVSIPAAAKDCLSQFGNIDGVVNAAGINLRQQTEEVSIESWNQTLNINLAAPFFFSRELIPVMKQNGYGRIVNIASLQSTRAFPNGLAYGASKGGVCQLTRAMSETWSKFGVNSNAIAPGFFPTELTAPVFDNPETLNWAANQTTVGRNGELKDLAGISVFFCSEASAYVTGQTLHIDGGFTAR